MGKFRRWAFLAAFCVLFGFLGSAGGLWLMKDSLRGPQGERGESIEGPPGPQGEPVALPRAMVLLPEQMQGLSAAQQDINGRIDDLAAEVEQVRATQDLSVVQPTDCDLTQVVTGVTWNEYSYEQLQVQSRWVCLPSR